jgi:MraZ protein
MYSFIGNSEAKVDNKGRVFIPAHYRKALSDEENAQLVMRKDPYSNSLVFYPESIWNEKLTLLKSELNEWNPTHQILLMQYVGEAELLDIDSQGRVLIPKKYLVLTGIESDVLFVGMLNTFSLWSKPLFEKVKYSPAEFSQLLQSILTVKQK